MYFDGKFGVSFLVTPLITINSTIRVAQDFSK